MRPTNVRYAKGKLYFIVIGAVREDEDDFLSLIVNYLVNKRSTFFS